MMCNRPENLCGFILSATLVMVLTSLAAVLQLVFLPCPNNILANFSFLCFGYEDTMVNVASHVYGPP